MNFDVVISGSGGGPDKFMPSFRCALRAGDEDLSVSSSGAVEEGTVPMPYLGDDPLL